MSRFAEASRMSAVSVGVNFVLALVKLGTGVVGQSTALLADAAESLLDLLGSLVVWGAVRVAAQPPDANHPFGHGKAEPVAGLVVAMAMVLAAGWIAAQAIGELRQPGPVPEWFTLPVLAAVIAIKEGMFQLARRAGRRTGSSALTSDAWHHRSDAITSAAALVGVLFAVTGGPRYAAADDWAALVACGIIVFNAIGLLRAPLDEIMDASAPEDVERRVRALAREVPGVLNIEKCRIRKSGFAYLIDIHVIVDGEIPVREGHRIGHEVQAHLCASPWGITDVLVHIEPSPGPSASAAASASSFDGFKNRHRWDRTKLNEDQNEA